MTERETKRALRHSEQRATSFLFSLTHPCPPPPTRPGGSRRGWRGDCKKRSKRRRSRPRNQETGSAERERERYVENGDSSPLPLLPSSLLPRPPSESIRAWAKPTQDGSGSQSTITLWGGRGFEEGSGANRVTRKYRSSASQHSPPPLPPQRETVRERERDRQRVRESQRETETQPSRWRRNKRTTAHITWQVGD